MNSSDFPSLDGDETKVLLQLQRLGVAASLSQAQQNLDELLLDQIQVEELYSALMIHSQDDDAAAIALIKRSPMLAFGVSQCRGNVNYKANCFHLAARKGRDDVLRVISEQFPRGSAQRRWLVRSTTNGDFNQGEYALHIAAYYDHQSTIELLLQQYEMDINLKSHKYEYTALHLAALRGGYTSCAFLISKCATVDAIDVFGSTPLMKAASIGRTDICELLLDSKANVNYVNDFGESALYKAAEEDDSSGHVDVCKLLLKRGARVGLTENGKSAIDVARKKGHHQILKLLEDAFAAVLEEEKASNECSEVLTLPSLLNTSSLEETTTNRSNAVDAHCSSSTVQLKESDTACSALQAEVQAHEARLHQLQSEFDEAHARADPTAFELKHKSELLSQKRNELEALTNMKNENDALVTAQRAQLDNQSKKSILEREQLQQKHYDLERSFGEHEQKLQVASAQSTQCPTELVAAAMQLKAKDEQIESCEKYIKQQAEQIAVQKERLASSERAHIEQKAAAEAAYQALLHQVQSELAQTHRRADTNANEFTTEQIVQLRHELTEAIVALQSNAVLCAQLNDEKASLTSQRDQLQQQLIDRERTIDELQVSLVVTRALANASAQLQIALKDDRIRQLNDKIVELLRRYSEYEVTALLRHQICNDELAALRKLVKEQADSHILRTHGVSRR